MKSVSKVVLITKKGESKIVQLNIPNGRKIIALGAFIKDRAFLRGCITVLSHDDTYETQEAIKVSFTDFQNKVLLAKGIDFSLSGVSEQKKPVDFEPFQSSFLSVRVEDIYNKRVNADIAYSVEVFADYI